MDDATRDGEDEEESRVDRVDGATTAADGDAESEEDATARTERTREEEDAREDAREGVDRVRVVVRVRPGDGPSAVSADGRAVRVAGGGRTRRRRGAAEREKVAFRGPCAGTRTTQDAFFDVSGVKALLMKTLDGYASAVFAYGQTGSGKTYTMLGRAGARRGASESASSTRDDVETASTSSPTMNDVGSDDGLIGRSIEYLFDALGREAAGGGEKAPTKVVVSVTSYEIYKEKVIDLLADESSKSLRVRWRSRDGFYVPNLSRRECANAGEALDCVREGAARRRVRSHKMNAESSRSHAVLTVHVERYFGAPRANGGGDRDDDVGASCDDSGDVEITRGKMTFVDLAGSERLKHSGSEDAGSRETSLINKSLFALGKVISILADESRDAKATTPHVPYRDSKLTKLLMDSLGGRSLTLMIACCSANERHVEETIRTLQYAARVTSIVNIPESNTSRTTETIDARASPDALVDELRAENCALRRRIAALTRAADASTAICPTPSSRQRRVSNSIYHTSDVITRVSEVERLLSRYAEENRRLERENDALRASRELVHIERAHALADVTKLRRALAHVQDIFFTDD